MGKISFRNSKSSYCKLKEELNLQFQLLRPINSTHCFHFYVNNQTDSKDKQGWDYFN